MDRVSTVQDEAATATNPADANSTPEQNEEVSSVSLKRCARSLSLTNYFSSLALQAVNTAKSRDEKLAKNEVEEGTEPVELASKCIASLSICQRAREDISSSSSGGSSRELEEQQLRSAKRLCIGGQPNDLNGFKLPKTYFCGYCNKTFLSAAYYCRHLRRHVNLWRCDKCNQGFRLFALKRHHRKMCVKLMWHQNKRKYYSRFE